MDHHLRGGYRPELETSDMIVGDDMTMYVFLLDMTVDRSHLVDLELNLMCIPCEFTTLHEVR